MNRKRDMIREKIFDQQAQEEASIILSGNYFLSKEDSRVNSSVPNVEVIDGKVDQSSFYQDLGAVMDEEMKRVNIRPESNYDIPSLGISIVPMQEVQINYD